MQPGELSRRRLYPREQVTACAPAPASPQRLLLILGDCVHGRSVCTRWGPKVCAQHSACPSPAQSRGGGGGGGWKTCLYGSGKKESRLASGLPLYTSPNRSCRGRPPPRRRPQVGLLPGGLAWQPLALELFPGRPAPSGPDGPTLAPETPRLSPGSQGAAEGSPPALNVTYLHRVRLLRNKTKRTKQNKTQALHRVPGRHPGLATDGRSGCAGRSLGAEHTGLGGPRRRSTGPGPRALTSRLRLLPLGPRQPRLLSARGGAEETAAGLPPARSPIAGSWRVPGGVFAASHGCGGPACCVGGEFFFSIFISLTCAKISLGSVPIRP